MKSISQKKIANILQNLTIILFEISNPKFSPLDHTMNAFIGLLTLSGPLLLLFEPPPDPVLPPEPGPALVWWGCVLCPPLPGWWLLLLLLLLFILPGCRGWWWRPPFCWWWCNAAAVMPPPWIPPPILGEIEWGWCPPPPRATKSKLYEGWDAWTSWAGEGFISSSNMPPWEGWWTPKGDPEGSSGVRSPRQNAAILINYYYDSSAQTQSLTFLTNYSSAGAWWIIMCISSHYYVSYTIHKLYLNTEKKNHFCTKTKSFLTNIIVPENINFLPF